MGFIGTPFDARLYLPFRHQTMDLGRVLYLAKLFGGVVPETASQRLCLWNRLGVSDWRAAAR